MSNGVNNVQHFTHIYGESQKDAKFFFATIISAIIAEISRFLLTHVNKNYANMCMSKISHINTINL
jgi:hypothetical protein